MFILLFHSFFSHIDNCLALLVWIHNFCILLQNTTSQFSLLFVSLKIIRIINHKLFTFFKFQTKSFLCPSGFLNSDTAQSMKHLNYSPVEIIFWFVNNKSQILKKQNSFLFKTLVREPGDEESSYQPILQFYTVNVLFSVFSLKYFVYSKLTLLAR